MEQSTVTIILTSQKELHNILEESRKLNGHQDMAPIHLEIKNGDLKVSHPELPKNRVTEV